MNTVKILTGKKTKIIAHRGLSGIECENTCAAFIAAANRSYFGIEADIRTTADGKFVAIHDRTTKNVSEENLTVSKTDFSRLRKVILNNTDGSVGRGDMIIPSFLEYFEICKKYNKCAVIELKESLSATSIKRLCEEIKATPNPPELIFISTDFDRLKEARKVLSKAHAQLIIPETLLSASLINKLKLHKMDVGVNHIGLKKDEILMCHKAGLKVNCWTVNEQKTAEKLIRFGADFITTDILE